MSYSDVKIVTLSEGEVSHLNVGLNGTHALLLKDLAGKAHRGLRGRIEVGKSGGGNSYDYDVVKSWTSMVLTQFLLQTPGARRSAHPDASIVAVGPVAGTLTQPHELGQAFGPGSPLERFAEHGGKVLLLGAPLNSVTFLHYAEAIAHPKQTIRDL